MATLSGMIVRLRNCILTQIPCQIHPECLTVFDDFVDKVQNFGFSDTLCQCTVPRDAALSAVFQAEPVMADCLTELDHSIMHGGPACLEHLIVWDAFVDLRRCLKYGIRLRLEVEGTNIPCSESESEESEGSEADSESSMSDSESSEDDEFYQEASAYISDTLDA